MTNLDHALRWYDSGVTPIPLRPMSKAPLVWWKKLQKIIPGRNVIELWFERPDRNLAVLCGGQTNLTVLDFDSMAAWAEWRVDAPALAQTYSVRTKRGVHAYFSTDTPLPTRLKVGLADVKANGYVLGVPSVHPSGALYRVWNDAPVLKVQTDDLMLSLPGRESVPAVERLPVDPIEPPFSMRRLVDQIKAAWPILYLARSITDLQSTDGGAGTWYMGICPFHEDHAPSFWVNTKRGRYGCFSPACEAHRSGDVIDLYGRLHSLSTRLAIQAMSLRLSQFQEEAFYG